MTEYWKSNPRKFCDFCKCWIADNKPSIDFHEKGKRHKENVKVRLEQMAKKGKEDYSNELKKDDYMKQMEAAALKAYKKDIERNPDLMGAKISEMASSTNAQIVVETQSPPKKETKIKKIPKPKKWREAKSDDGHLYYWNTDTNESVWEAPAGGYLSIKEQDETNKRKNSKNLTNNSFGPQERAIPYSSWQTVVKSDAIDLQLPELPEETFTPPVVVFSKPRIEFKERKVKLEVDNSSSTVSFKKRSQNSDTKRNVRTRTENV